MNDIQIINYIPLHYVVPVQEKAREKGLKVPEPELIRNVRHKKQFNRQIVDILVELARENRTDMKKMCKQYDRSEKVEIVRELIAYMDVVNHELLEFPIPDDILEEEKDRYIPSELLEITNHLHHMQSKLHSLVYDYKKTLNAA